MKKGLLVILSLLFSFAGYANQCSEYWYKYNYEKAFTSCKEEAELGNAEAQYYLAYMYYNGEGVEKDEQEAVYWSTKAAEQGNAEAQYYLVYMYYNGEGEEVDEQEAAYWSTKAAEQGNTDAQYYLAYNVL